MKMKKWILALCAGGLATVASAQSVPQVAVLDSATVYVQGAELLHRAQAQLTAGANTLRLSGVARTLDERSLRIDLPDGVNLLSVQQVGIDGDGAPLLGYSGNPEDRCLAVSIDSAKRELEEIRNRLLAEEGTLALLDENQQLGGTAGGTTIDELKRYIDYYKKERLATRDRIIALNAEQTRAQHRLDSLENVWETKQAARGGGGSQLELQLYTERAVAAPIAIRYITPLAGWAAFYDLRVSSISAPLSLVYKAQVYQHTGVDWKQVTLTLATGSPADGGTAPRFEPWFLHVMPPAPQPVYAPEADLAMKEDRVLEEVMVTSADSGMFVMNSIATKNAQISPKWQTIGWGVLLATLALMLLNAGGLAALQSMTLITALPFSVIMLLFIISLVKALSIDQSYYERDFSVSTVPWSGSSWKERLKQIISFDDNTTTSRYINTTVKEAFSELQQEFARNNIEAKINVYENPQQIEIEIPYDVVNNFVYGVKSEVKIVSDYLVEEDNLPDVEDNRIYFPKSYFGDDREGYDVQLFTKNELISDVLKHYERFIEIISEKRNGMFISSDTNQRLR